MELITWQNIKPIFHRTSVRKFQSVQTTEERRFALNTSCIRDRTWWCAGRDLTFTRSFPTCLIPPSQGLFPRLLQTSACERFRKPLGLGAILLSPPSLLFVARAPVFLYLARFRILLLLRLAGGMCVCRVWQAFPPSGTCLEFI